MLQSVVKGALQTLIKTSSRGTTNRIYILCRNRGTYETKQCSNVLL